MPTQESYFDLFGGTRPWQADDWVASDDRVRGGKSQSYLDSSSSSNTVVFHGNLDIATLGGAGFASRRSPDPQGWDLSHYTKLRLGVGKSDGKRYTLILKDEVLPKRPDGREQSTVSWEYDFTAQETTLDIAWADFKPTYRGKPKPDAQPLKLSNIKRVSIMMRSFFGEQEGEFNVELESIAAVKPSNSLSEASSTDLKEETQSFDSRSDVSKGGERPAARSWLACLQGFFKL
ncbi:CIA30 family protein-like protein [Xylariaceae sp. FL0016]|nr:CIA30 family protein-like protein [Xylariaceae sp. FL0016]